MSNNDELKPCPFCGGEGLYEYIEGVPRRPRPRMEHYICCANYECDIDLQIQENTKKEAIKAWNTRADHKAVDVECPFTRQEMKETLDTIILDDKEDEICGCIKEPCKWLLERYLSTPPVPQEDAKKALDAFETIILDVDRTFGEDFLNDYLDDDGEVSTIRKILTALVGGE